MQGESARECCQETKLESKDNSGEGGFPGMGLCLRGSVGDLLGWGERKGPPGCSKRVC